ncbi:MAG: potassium transporter Kup [Thermodesulfovibrionales bacterium]
MKKESPAKGVLQSLGLVYGDIGTSPIYTLTVIFLLTRPTQEHVVGVLSLIVWTLVTLVTVEYAWLAMSLGKKGEGGTIVLKEILVPLLRSGRKAAFAAVLAHVGVALLMGDGVITPAISILSAVEGTLLIPGLEGTGQGALVLLAGAIAVGLFAVQRRGTARVAGAFGPVMLLWFLCLAASGAVYVVRVPAVLGALNPWHGLRFLLESGVTGFFVLSEVILCATGAEALYADMGHLGREPIIRGWYFVFAALLLNYLGQGAYLVEHPGAGNVLFEMVFSEARALYVPFLVLSVAATVIASQAMISGMFSIVYQAMTTRIMPMLRVDYTSPELRSQVYVGLVNWALLASVLFVMYVFGESHRLAAAYGLAVTGTMTITGVMMTWIFGLRRRPFLAAVSALVTAVDAVFLLSNSYKIPHGGYWSVILAAAPFSVILLYTYGQRRLYRSLRPLGLGEFLERFGLAYATARRLKGTALFFLREVSVIPPYVARTMFSNHIIYDDNVFVSVIRRDDPFGVAGYFKEDLARGLRVFEIQMGYMEVIDVEGILREAGIREDVIFYGVEDIATRNPLWKAFALIKRVAPSYVQFFRLPPSKLHGVMTRLEM